MQKKKDGRTESIGTAAAGLDPIRVDNVQFGGILGYLPRRGSRIQKKRRVLGRQLPPVNRMIFV